MIGYRNIDLSTVSSIPSERLELAKQQVEAYWSAPWYMALMGFVERVFAICLHVGLSVMVLYALVARQPVWFWIALLWHAVVNAVAVYVGQQVGILPMEGLVGPFAIFSLWMAWWLRGRFPADAASVETQTLEGTA